MISRLRIYPVLLFLAVFLLQQVLYGQGLEDFDYTKVASVLKRFKTLNDSLEKIYGQEGKKPRNYAFTYADAICFEYSGNRDTLIMIYKELKAGIAFGTIAQRHGLKEFDDYAIAWLKKPKIENECFHKLVFHTVPRLNRYDNIVMELKNDRKDPAKYKKGTRLVDTLDGELTCIEFLGAYKKTMLPDFLSRGMFYYETITGGKDPLFLKLDRLRDYEAPELEKLDSLWEGYPSAPVAPIDPGNLTALQKDSFAVVKKNYQELLNNYRDRKSLKFQMQVSSDPVLMNFLYRFLEMPKKYHIGLPYTLQERMDYLGLKIEAPEYVAPHGARRYTYRQHLRVLASAIDKSNEQLFARTLYFYDKEKPSHAVDSLLKEVSRNFYTYPDLFACGYISAAVLSPDGDWSYNLVSVERIENPEVKKKVIAEIEKWLISKPPGSPLVYIMASYYAHWIDESEGDDEEVYKAKLNKMLLPYPEVKKMIDEE